MSATRTWAEVDATTTLPSLAPALHLGTLHPLEHGLVLLLAFGPFLVLGVVVRRQRRRDAPPEDDPPAR